VELQLLKNLPPNVGEMARLARRYFDAQSESNKASIARRLARLTIGSWEIARALIFDSAFAPTAEAEWKYIGTELRPSIVMNNLPTSHGPGRHSIVDPRYITIQAGLILESVSRKRGSSTFGKTEAGICCLICCK
jgi:hypothetical protein